jgi:hypothetical protein
MRVFRVEMSVSRVWIPHRSPQFFELVTNFLAMFLQLMPNGGVTFRNLADVASECFGDHAKMTFDLFHLLGVHGSLV